MLLKWNFFSCVIGLFVFHFLFGGRQMMGKSGPKMKFFILECYFKDYLLSEYSEVQDVCLLTYLPAESI